MFATFGISTNVISDNGSQFTFEKYRTFYPHTTQLKAGTSFKERTTQAVKNYTKKAMMVGNEDPHLVALALRTCATAMNIVSCLRTHIGHTSRITTRNPEELEQSYKPKEHQGA